ncbi:MULE transposase domain [Dillenia turbinata]|uniref:Protein FAR1-RELATED SEQUENCE n=1 Tax=Dillenia turbinata TaxID=194707 RepID=A0AAN8UNM7_9MAGN
METNGPLPSTMLNTVSSYDALISLLSLHYMSGSRQRTLGGGGQRVLDYLKRMQAENPAFFYSIQGDSEHSAGNVFWADASSRMNYNYFGDTVIFDTMYRISRFRVPFATFTGVNHHGQPVLFGCAILLNESESSFVWLFQTWLHAMSGRCPVSITTDPDRLIQLAVTQVLPETRLRFNKWIIYRETQEKLAHIYQSHPAFEIEFQKCIDEMETVEEFESCWESLLGRYYLMDNEWLQSMYNARQQWVPVYLRDTFFGELSAAEGSAGVNPFFDGFVTAATTLQMLIKQYEKAVNSWHEKEIKADSDTVNIIPVLKTPSPMEKQAANIYTRRIFMKFQEELVETLANPATKIEESGTITIYRVAKFGEDLKAHTVRFNAFEMKASCSCQIHILAVFKAKNVLTLPSQYVMKRWTRNAKSGIMVDGHALDVPTNSQESLMVRYSNLRQEAIKFVEEGAKSIHVYNVAMDALQEASKKVAALKSQANGSTQTGNLANGGNRELAASDETAPYQSTAEKEKRIRELTAELETTNRRCEVYRANLLSVLKDMEEEKLKLSVKVQNARLSLKE